MSIGAAIVASAVIGAGSAAYSASEQKRLANEEAARVRRAEADRKKEAERIARETRPDAKTAKSAKFGKDSGSDSTTAKGNLEFTKKSTSALGVTGGSGLGFTV